MIQCIFVYKECLHIQLKQKIKELPILYIRINTEKKEILLPQLSFTFWVSDNKLGFHFASIWTKFFISVKLSHMLHNLLYLVYVRSYTIIEYRQRSMIVIYYNTYCFITVWAENCMNQNLVQSFTNKSIFISGK